MSERIEVATTDEISEDSCKLVDVKGVELGIRCVNDEYYAILNSCPHQNGPIATGDIQRPITAEIPDTGERTEQEYDDECMVVRCPLHGWSYDIETGENIGDRENAPQLPVYDVVVEDECIYIEL